MPIQKKSILQKLTSTSFVTLLTCPANSEIDIARLNIANIAGVSDSFELCVTRGGTDFFEQKGLIVPASASFKVEGPIILEPGDTIRIKAATANRLDVVGSYLLKT
jgi:hypothetical protein